jgi:hypothetical protein
LRWKIYFEAKGKKTMHNIKLKTAWLMVAMLTFVPLAQAAEYTYRVIESANPLDINARGEVLSGNAIMGKTPVRCPVLAAGMDGTEAASLTNKSSIVGSCSIYDRTLDPWLPNSSGFVVNRKGHYVYYYFPDIFFRSTRDTQATAASDDDAQVVGWYCQSYDQAFNGCKYAGWHFADGAYRSVEGPAPQLSPNDGTAVILTGVNRRGTIVGYYFETFASDPLRRNLRAFLLQNGQYTALNLPGSNHTLALDLNNDDMVLLHSGDKFYLWDDGKHFPVELNPPGAAYYTITGFNDKEEYTGTFTVQLGTGIDPWGRTYPILAHYAFVATPVENHARAKR